MTTATMSPVYATDVDGSTKVMDHNGWKATLHRTRLLTDKGVNSLPPRNPIPVFPIDRFKVLPQGWATGPGVYLVPVCPDWAIWFDWTANPIDTAIIASIKGVSPFTGMPMNSMLLEQYRDKCPVHGVPFQGDKRFCPKCNDDKGMQWAPQNYLTVVKQERLGDYLWWDGFWIPGDMVRQFYITADDSKAVPEHLIGKENTVPAFGFSFHPSRVPANPPQYRGRPHSGFGIPSGYFSAGGGGHNPQVKHFMGGPPDGVLYSKMGGPPKTRSLSFEVNTKSAAPPPDLKKEASVGAGERIKQALTLDPKPVEHYVDVPAGRIVLYFCFEPQFREIVAGGLNDLDGDPEGFLNQIQTGHDGQ